MMPVLPGAKIGVLGSGQLGRMFAIAARQMGYRVHTYSPDSDTPAGQVSDIEVTAPYEDLDCVRDFARSVSVVTFEFENVPAGTAAAAAEYAPVRPGGSVLHVTQHRLREKTFLRQAGFPTAKWFGVDTEAELLSAANELNGNGILKSAGFGYDGKGQARFRQPAQAAAAWDEIGRVPAVLEELVDFEQEISVVAARGHNGEYAAYPPVSNQHRNGILDITVAPARISSNLAAEALSMTREVFEHLGAVGVLCVEFFVRTDGRLLINELAPRPHNSGHWTVDASLTSQFEQQLRAVCGLPLGDTTPLAPAAMANLLGECWSGGEPDWSAVCRHPSVKLHLYGKTDPRPGRKMGHLTAVGPDAEESVRSARRSLISLSTTPLL